MVGWLAISTSSGQPLVSVTRGVSKNEKIQHDSDLINVLASLSTSLRKTGITLQLVSSDNGNITFRYLSCGLVLIFTTSIVVSTSDACPNANLQSKLDRIIDAIVFLLGTTSLILPSKQTESTQRLQQRLQRVVNFIKLYIVDEVDSYITEYDMQDNKELNQISDPYSDQKYNMKMRLAYAKNIHHSCFETSLSPETTISEQMHRLEVDSVTLTTSLPEVIVPSNSFIRTHVHSVSHMLHVQHVALYSRHRLYSSTVAWSALDCRDLYTIGMFMKLCSDLVNIVLINIIIHNSDNYTFRWYQQ
jgi:hypothetical protein